MQFKQGGRDGTLDYKIHWYPKFYNQVFLFIDFKNGYLDLDLKLSISKHFNQNDYNLHQGLFLCIIDHINFTAIVLSPKIPEFKSLDEIIV